jgi:hypothetical protein
MSPGIRCGRVPAQMWAQSRRSPGAHIGLIGSSCRFVCSPSFGVLLDILKDVRPILLSALDTMPRGIYNVARYHVALGYHAAQDTMPREMPCHVGYHATWDFLPPRPLFCSASRKVACATTLSSDWCDATKTLV